jgi:predicted transcriptional regulator
MTDLTPGELEVMEVLWRHGPLKPAEILEHLDRPLSNPALRSVLRVLLEKEHVTRTRRGKAYYYRPRRPAPVALRRMTRKLADIFCGGSSLELIARLVREEKLSPDDVRALQQIANEREATKPRSKKQKGA